MKLSIIVCVCNTDKNLLFECLSSLKSSTLAQNYELLLIDDGSSVDYGDIAEDFGARYHKTENRGQLCARLCGISLARGDYVAFVDSDDTVSLNYHRPMLDAIEKQDADIVINGWAFHTERTKRVTVNDSSMSEKISVLGDNVLRLYTSQQGREHSYFVLWNKLYRREVMLKMKSTLDSLGISGMRLTYSEDALMNFFIFKYAQKVININSGFYFYRIHDSQSVAVSGKANLKSKINSICFSIGIMEENIGKNIYARDISRDLARWRALMARTHFGEAKARRYKELYDYIKGKYRIKKNERPRWRDGEVYRKCELLGENFEEIDFALSRLYFLDKETSASYERRSKSISRIIRDMPHKVYYSRAGDITVPKRKIRIRDKLMHSALLYRLGTAIFKKGSRARAFLKKHF